MKKLPNGMYVDICGNYKVISNDYFMRFSNKFIKIKINCRYAIKRFTHDLFSTE